MSHHASVDCGEWWDDRPNAYDIREDIDRKTKLKYYCPNCGDVHAGWMRPDGAMYIMPHSRVTYGDSDHWFYKRCLGGDVTEEDRTP